LHIQQINCLWKTINFEKQFTNEGNVYLFHIKHVHAVCVCVCVYAWCACVPVTSSVEAEVSCQGNPHEIVDSVELGTCFSQSTWGSPFILILPVLHILH
jgi:hypothetical protein